MTQNDWREFERLVALIEHHLAPKGAVVRSPDHLTDKRTGQSREVDASIRYVVGSVTILITVECRERSHNEDVTWGPATAGSSSSPRVPGCRATRGARGC